MDPRPAAGCGFGSVGHAKPRPDAGQLEVAGEREAVRRVDGSDRELFGVVVVVGRAGVEVFVALRRGERGRGVEEASVGLVGRRLPVFEGAEAPQVGGVVVVEEREPRP